jgi:WhiB family redox-sensing transcriptional regulator
MSPIGRILLSAEGEDLAWENRAACIGQDTSLFFADKWTHVDVRAATAKAKGICFTCPVRLACLEYALRTQRPSHEYGVYGGATAKERKKIRRARSAA